MMIASLFKIFGQFEHESDYGIAQNFDDTHGI